MDSLTTKVAQSPTEALGAIIALSILVVVLLAYIYDKYSNCTCSSSTSASTSGQSSFWGQWPLWQYGWGDGGMYGSMGRPETPYQQWAVTGQAPSAEAIRRYEHPAVVDEASALLHAQGDRYQTSLSDEELIRASRVDSADA